MADAIGRPRFLSLLFPSLDYNYLEAIAVDVFVGIFLGRIKKKSVGGSGRIRGK